MESSIFGIDLGTTYSCIAQVDSNGQPTVILNKNNDATTPSVVFFDPKDGNVIVGKIAKKHAVIDEGRVVSLVKRAMGNPDWVQVIDGKEYKPEDISSLILRKIVQDASQTTGYEIKDVVITHPAWFGIQQKEATQRAGILAGLNVVSLIPEPTAAAIAYGMTENDAGNDQVVLVYDLGGGTFDATVIEIKDKAITAITTGGDHTLGGVNWDNDIVNFLASEFEKQTSIPAENLLADKLMYQELLQEAEDMKMELSDRESAQRVFRFEAESATIELTREKFEELTSRWLEQSISYMDDTLRRAAEKGYPKIDRILLVGGSTFMPQVEKRLQSYNVPLLRRDPNQIVAKGAAYFGFFKMLNQEIVQHILDEKNVSPDEPMPPVTPEEQEQATKEVGEKYNLSPRVIENLGKKITIVTPKSFGIKVMTENDEKKGNNLIIRNTELPCDATKTYGVYSDNQTAVEIEVFENTLSDGPESYVELENCIDMETRTLTFLKPLPKGAPIDIKFTMNDQGLLHIEAFDKTTDQQIDFDLQTEIQKNEELANDQKRLLSLKVS